MPNTSAPTCAVRALIGRFVALAAMGRRREIGRVGFDQNAVNRRGGKDIAQLLRLGKVAMPDIDR